jgi:heme-degrading monooxygenase HmoA
MMFARLWCGRSLPKNAFDYAAHVSDTVFPSLRKMHGYRGAQLLRRAIDGRIEFLAVTYWDQLDDVRQFAGGDIEVAKIEPRAKELLSDYDSLARHFELIHTVDDPTGAARN